MMRLLTALRARLIDDARLWWRWWSTWLQGFGVVLGTVAEPLSSALNTLPPDMRASIPFLHKVAIFLVVAGWLARFIKQGRPDA